MCRNLVRKEKVDSFIRCPGFSHKEVAQILEVVGGNVGVFVARGDGPSNRASSKVRERKGYRGMHATIPKCEGSGGKICYT